MLNLLKEKEIKKFRFTSVDQQSKITQFGIKADA